MNPKFLDKSIYIKSKKMADEKFEKILLISLCI